MLANCRLCLAKSGNFLISNGQAALRILSCTGLEVNADDKLPQLICQACRLRLEEFHFFRKRCHAADQRLRYLKRCGHTNNVQPTGEDEEDELILKDVAQCSMTACSESNALWRKNAAQIIRSEIDAYKKELLGLCKQQVREEIEQQVRTEIEKSLLAQAQNDCRLNVLDDVFYEIETFFVNKRNETVRKMGYGSEGFGSDMEATEMGSLSTIECPPKSNVELTSTENYTDASEVTILEVLDDDPPQQIPASTTPVVNISSEISNSNKETVARPIPMVVINMDNEHQSHLREDLTSQFLPFKSAPSATTNEQPHLRSSQKVVRSKSMSYRIPRKEDSHYNLRMQTVCQEHKSQRKNQKKDCFKPNYRNCYRCRQRGKTNHNKSVA